MKTFDLIDSVSFGYRSVWRERGYLLKLAIVPILIKLASTVVVFSFGYEENYIRQGLISIPSALAEGWLLAQFLRTLLLGERWPIMLDEEPNEQQMSALLLRARGIMSSAIMYTLITLAAYGMKELYTYFYNLTGGEKAVETDAQASPLMFIPAVALIYLSIWIFRLLWLYIPVVVLMPITDFLKKLGGFMTSIRMIGIFLVSMVPCFVVAIVFSNILTAVVGGPDSDMGRFVMMIISVLIETLISVITTASMVYALRHILPHDPRVLSDINKV